MTGFEIKLIGNEKFLIIRPDRLGDLVLSLPVAACLKKIYPRLTIHYLASSYNATALRFTSDVSGFIPFTRADGRPQTAGRLIEFLEAESYDVALFLKPNWLSAFAAYLAGIPARVGTGRRPYSFLFNIRENIGRKNSGMHEIDLNLMMLRPFGIHVEPGTLSPVLEVDDGNAENCEVFDIKDDYIVIHPGTAGSAPNCPIQWYLDLASVLSKEIRVVLTGQGPFQLDIDGKIYNLINKTNLMQLVNVISRARLFISGSTGPIHLAAALGTPSLGFYPDHPYFGPQRWGPRGRKVTVITPDKLNGHICRIKNNGSCDCMEAIKVNAVYDTVRKLLEPGENSP